MIYTWPCIVGVWWRHGGTRAFGAVDGKLEDPVGLKCRASDGGRRARRSVPACLGRRTGSMLAPRAGMRRQRWDLSEEGARGRARWLHASAGAAHRRA